MKKLKDRAYYFLIPILKQLGLVQPRKWKLSPFRKLIKDLSNSSKVLEIGPFYQPSVEGKNVKYFDVLNQQDLIQRAEEYNKNKPLQVSFIQKDNVPFIDFVSENGDLKIIDEKFNYVVSSHCIEHQPDLVQHLLDVNELLYPGGKYYVIVPDKRYCFDHYNCESKLQEVLQAQIEKRKKHTLKSVITHRLSMQTHNDPFKHWNGNHGKIVQNLDIVKDSIEEFKDSNYVNVHAWYFTPESFSKIITGLNHLGLVQLEIENIFPTEKNTFEFYVILKKNDGSL